MLQSSLSILSVALSSARQTCPLTSSSAHLCFQRVQLQQPSFDTSVLSNNMHSSLFLHVSSSWPFPSYVFDSCMYQQVFNMSSNVLLEVLIIQISLLPYSKSASHPLNYVQKHQQIVVIQIVVFIIKHQTLTLNSPPLFFLQQRWKKQRQNEECTNSKKMYAMRSMVGIFLTSLNLYLVEHPLSSSTNLVNLGADPPFWWTRCMAQLMDTKSVWLEKSNQDMFWLIQNWWSSIALYGIDI